MKKIEEKEKFEFLLSINDNIICQRYFTVRNHSPKTIKSVDLYETVLYIKDIISNKLILKTIDVIDEFFKEDVSKLQVEPNNGKNILCRPLSTKSKIFCRHKTTNFFYTKRTY